MSLELSLSSFNLLDVIGGIFVCIGLLFIYPAFRYISDDVHSRTWPQIVATLKHIEAFETIIQGTERNNYQSYVRHGCRLQYEYRFEGNDYEAISVVAAADKQDAGRIAASHSPGATIPLHYNPKIPQHYRSIDTPATNNIIWLAPIIGFCGFGLLVLYISRRFY
jgi:hypothetical protein